MAGRRNGELEEESSSSTLLKDSDGFVDTSSGEDDEAIGSRFQMVSYPKSSTTAKQPPPTNSDEDDDLSVAVSDQEPVAPGDDGSDEEDDEIGGKNLSEEKKVNNDVDVAVEEEEEERGKSEEEKVNNDVDVAVEEEGGNSEENVADEEEDEQLLPMEHEELEVENQLPENDDDGGDDLLDKPNSPTSETSLTPVKQSPSQQPLEQEDEQKNNDNAQDRPKKKKSKKTNKKKRRMSSQDIEQEPTDVVATATALTNNKPEDQDKYVDGKKKKNKKKKLKSQEGEQTTEAAFINNNPKEQDMTEKLKEKPALEEVPATDDGFSKSNKKRNSKEIEQETRAAASLSNKKSKDQEKYEVGKKKRNKKKMTSQENEETVAAKEQDKNVEETETYEKEKRFKKKNDPLVDKKKELEDRAIKDVDASLNKNEKKRNRDDDAQDIPAPTDGIMKTPKKSKKLVEQAVEETSTRVGLFQKVWTDSDEIALLQGMIDFKAKNNLDASSNIDSFTLFLKPHLSFSPTKTQVSDKVRRLKGKYSKNSSKKSITFISDHAQQVYQLSSLVWENNKVVAHAGKNDNANDGQEVVGNGPSFVFEMDKISRYGAMLFGGHHEDLQYQQWKNLCRRSLEIDMARLDLMKEKLTMMWSNMQ